MRTVETYGHITDGKLHIHHKQRFVDALKLWPDCRVTVKVEKVYKKRGNQQNKYYWGVVINDFVKGYNDMTGDTISSEQAHEILKNQCNFVELVNENTGEAIKIGSETKSLTTIEFEEYLERCQVFILEWFGIRVLLPNEQGELFI